MSYDPERQRRDNEYALANPQPGDYWQERFCPYFVVVDVKGTDFIVLSCLGGPHSFARKDEPCAKIEVDACHWAFDYGKEITVDREWMRKAVRYESIDGFAADVSNTEKTRRIVQEWREYKRQTMLKEIVRLEEEYERFTGWKYLKEGIK